MLDLAKCLPLARAVADHIAAKGGRIFGIKNYLWNETSARQYNRLLIDDEAPELSGIRGIEEPALCATCNEVCLIVAFDRVDDQTQGVIHECMTCDALWNLPVVVYTEGITK